MKYLQKDRKEVFNILKQDYLPHVENAIQIVKLEQTMRKSEIKMENSENISNMNVKQENGTVYKNYLSNPSLENTIQNQLYQNILTLCFPNPFEIFNNLILFNIHGFN